MTEILHKLSYINKIALGASKMMALIPTAQKLMRPFNLGA